MSARAHREARYDADLVREIALQRAIAYLNDNPAVLRDRLRRDPGFVGKLRTAAAAQDMTARAWLQAVDYVPKDHPDYAREVTFRYWCLRLEPSEPPERLDGRPEREAFLRQQNYFYNFDVNVKPWLDAIDRVRHDRCIKLAGLPTESDEEWL